MTRCKGWRAVEGTPADIHACGHRQWLGQRGDTGVKIDKVDPYTDGQSYTGRQTVMDAAVWRSPGTGYMVEAGGASAGTDNE